jgi:hypothetical protein
MVSRGILSDNFSSLMPEFRYVYPRGRFTEPVHNTNKQSTHIIYTLLRNT